MVTCLQLMRTKAVLETEEGELRTARGHAAGPCGDLQVLRSRSHQRQRK